MSGNNTDEVTSSTEEEIVQETLEQEPYECDSENTVATKTIQRIVAEHEILEGQLELDNNSSTDDDPVLKTPAKKIPKRRKSNGKDRMKERAPEPENVLSMIMSLQSQLDTLRKNQQESSEEDPMEFRDRIMASNKINTQGQCTSGYKKPKVNDSTKKEVAKATKDTQLSTETKQQLSPAKFRQLSPAKRKQLSSAQSVNPGKAKKSKGSAPKTFHPIVENQNVFPTDSTNSSTANIVMADEQEVLQIHPDETDRDFGDEDIEDEIDPNEGQIHDNDDDDFQELVNAIDVAGEDEEPGVPLLETWAAKINLAWTTKMSKTNMTTVQGRYLVPSNLTDLKVPKMNHELWRMINKWQKKSDLVMGYTQKLLIKSVAAVLRLNNLCETHIPDRGNRIAAMRTTVDIVSMLGKVNTDIAQKRKATIRPNLKGDFKTLSSSTKVTDQLFGDNLTQDIKDIQVKRKIEENHFSNYTNRGYYNQNRRFTRGNYRGNYNNNGSSFLWRGRGRSRPPYYRAQGPYQQGQHQQKKH